jgi:2-amino-4-hydroxy-6-hydroxymethyldihydropteridine diphosphokinase
MPRVFISIGSNIDPETNIRKAVEALAKHIRITGISTVYLTTAIGRAGQPAFYNTVLATETGLDPRELKFSVLRRIEAELGRKRSADKYAPRPIDLDIAVYGGLVIDEPGLKIPDPDIYERAFLAAGLAELAPDMVLPDSGRLIRDVYYDMSPALMESLDELTASLRRACENLHDKP